MDFHRASSKHEVHGVRTCDLCGSHDPTFEQRDPLDKLIAAGAEVTARSHITENGYVRHRLVEAKLRQIAATPAKAS